MTILCADSLVFADVAINFAMSVEGLGTLISTMHVEVTKSCICFYILYLFFVSRLSIL